MLYWPQIEPGHSFAEHHVCSLYFPIQQLLLKLGPTHKRDDVDDAFFRLYWAASNPRRGGHIAQQLVEQGYDINFVIPGFAHPIFAAILGHAFGVAEQLVMLGTRPDHRDRDGVTALQRLGESIEWWKGRKDDQKVGDSIYNMAERRIHHLESALAFIAANSVTPG